MTGEVRAGTAALALHVVAVILWLALGPGPAGGHWGCTVTMADGRVVRTTTDPAAPASAIAFFTSSR